MIQLNACPFPAVLLEPRQATIKDGSPSAGGGSAWCGGLLRPDHVSKIREDNEFVIKAKHIYWIVGKQEVRAEQRVVQEG
jgi:hypothetical protein